MNHTANAAHAARAVNGGVLEMPILFIVCGRLLMRVPQLDRAQSFDSSQDVPVQQVIKSEGYPDHPSASWYTRFNLSVILAQCVPRQYSRVHSGHTMNFR